MTRKGEVCASKRPNMADNMYEKFKNAQNLNDFFSKRGIKLFCVGTFFGALLSKYHSV